MGGTIGSGTLNGRSQAIVREFDNVAIANGGISTEHGGSFIIGEATATPLRELGCRVTQIDPSPYRLIDDPRRDENRCADGAFVKEINTQPRFGRETISIRQHLRHHGRRFPELCAGVLEDATQRR